MGILHIALVVVQNPFKPDVSATFVIAQPFFPLIKTFPHSCFLKLRPNQSYDLSITLFTLLLPGRWTPIKRELKKLGRAKSVRC